MKKTINKEQLNKLSQDIVREVQKKHLPLSLQIAPMSFILDEVFDFKTDYVIFDSIYSSYPYRVLKNLPLRGNSSRIPRSPKSPSSLITYLKLEKANNSNRNFVAVLNFDLLTIWELAKVIEEFNDIRGKFLLLAYGSEESRARLLRNECKYTFMSNCNGDKLYKFKNILIKSKFHKGKSLVFYNTSAPIEIEHHTYLDIVEKNLSVNTILSDKVKPNVVKRIKTNTEDFYSENRKVIFSTETEYRKSDSRKGNLIEFVFSDFEIPIIPEKYKGNYFYPSSVEELKILARKAIILVGYNCIVVPSKLWEDNNVELYHNWRTVKSSEESDYTILTYGPLIESIKGWKKNIVSCTNLSNVEKTIFDKLKGRIVVIDYSMNSSLINTIAKQNKKLDVTYLHVFPKQKDLIGLREEFDLTEKSIEKRVENG